MLVCFTNNEAIGCGAFKKYDKETVEVKRMFVQPAHRGKSVASMVLKEMETWAEELHHTNTILETGKKQPEAIALYVKNGYTIIPNYRPYENIESSI